MSILINQKALLSALDKALPGIAKGSSVIEGADTFVFTDNGTVRTYNDNISVSVTAVALMGLSGTVKALDFHKTISKLSAVDEIAFDLTPDKWKLKAGRSKPTITCFQDSVSQYLECIDKDVTKWLPIPEDFLDALRLCFIAGNKVQKRGIYATEGTLYSTNGQILNRYAFTVEDAVPDFYLDDPAIAELLKLGKFQEINVGTGWVHFRGESDVVFSAKLKDRESYPIDGVAQYFAVADETEPLIVTVLPQALAAAADRVRVFGVDAEGVQAIEITLDKESIFLESKRVSGGLEEDVPWDIPLENLAAPVSALVDPAFLIEAVDKAPNLAVIVPEESPLLIFSSKKFTQIASTRARQQVA